MGNERFFDGDAAVGANDEIIDVPQNAAVKSDPLMLNATLKDLKPAAFKDDHDAKVIFENELGVGASDEIIDIDGRPEFDALVAATGGAERVKETAAALREALALVGVDALNYDELAEGLTPDEEQAEIVSTLAEWREVLGNPMQAQAMLQKIYAHPMQEPGRSYFMGRGSPALNDAIAKLWQATTGEPIVGRKKSRGDGHSY